MSSADAFFEQGHRTNVAFMGRPITCSRPTDTSATTVSATVSDERSERRTTDEGLEVLTLRDVIVEESTLPGGEARVDLTWTIDGESYTTDDIKDESGGFKCVVVCASDVRRPHRKNYFRG